MSRVRHEHTAPELIVRRLLHAHGFRYRLHYKKLPGKPDIVLPSKRKVIFVHGCFWHGHKCKIGQPPKSNGAFWTEKLIKNAARDAKNAQDLEALGWNVLTIWQCETRDPERMRQKLIDFVSDKREIE